MLGVIGHQRFGALEGEIETQRIDQGADFSLSHDGIVGTAGTRLGIGLDRRVTSSAQAQHPTEIGPQRRVPRIQRDGMVENLVGLGQGIGLAQRIAQRMPGPNALRREARGLTQVRDGGGGIAGLEHGEPGLDARRGVIGQRPGHPAPHRARLGAATVSAEAASVVGEDGGLRGRQGQCRLEGHDRGVDLARGQQGQGEKVLRIRRVRGDTDQRTGDAEGGGRPPFREVLESDGGLLRLRAVQRPHPAISGRSGSRRPGRGCTCCAGLRRPCGSPRGRAIRARRRSGTPLRPRASR